jgi:hypothetical protein
VDWLYVARLAGYVCIAEMPAPSVRAELFSVPPDGGPGTTTNVPPQTAVDRDEPILSDIPGLALQLSSRA